MPSPTAWVFPSPSPLLFHSPPCRLSQRPYQTQRYFQTPRPFRRPRSLPLCSASSPNPQSSKSQSPSPDPRGLNGTAPFYIALVAAQSLPLLFPHSGTFGDLFYFSTTAIALVIIGCRRAALEPLEFSSAISQTQALVAPFVASLVLFGSYLLLKYTQLDIGLVFNFFTTFAGSLCLKEALDPVFHSLLTLLGLQDTVFWQDEKNDTKGMQQVTLGGVLATVTAITTTAAYLLHIEPTFVFSNIIALGICARVLSLVRPSSFLVATALLVGLFFYDIFWVFGSEVMVSVATQIDSPGKLLFPRDVAQVAESTSKYPYAILGLGDVCIPGVFVTLAQGMDRVLAGEKEPYFWGAVAAYGVGLMTCFGVNFVTHAAQPALLYLVPAMVGGVLGVGVVRGEVGEVVKFKMGGDDAKE